MPNFPNDGSQKDNLLFLFCSHQLFHSFSPRVVSDSSCLLISFATPGSHDQGMRELSRVKGLPVPMLTGEKLMGVFSLLVLQSSAFIRMGAGYLDDPPGTCRNQITCPRGKKALKSLCLQCCSHTCTLLIHSIKASHKLQTILSHMVGV